VNSNSEFFWILFQSRSKDLDLGFGEGKKFKGDWEQSSDTKLM